MRQEHTANIVCPRCGQIGVVTWEMFGNERSLVGLSNGFYERISNKAPYPIELVCNDCGAAQAEK
jgi:hypothetical protein